MKHKILKIFMIFPVLFSFNKIIVLSQNQNVKEQVEIAKKNEKINKMINDFNKYSENDFKVNGFSLRIFKNNGLPFLEYVHDRTKAKILFVLSDSNKMSEFDKDSYFFRAFSADDYGMVNFLKSCLFQDLIMDFARYKQKVDGSNYLNVLVTKEGLQVIISRNENNQQFMENMFKNLKSPYALQDLNFFEVVKRAVINKVSSLGNKTKPNKGSSDFRETYGILGFAEDIEKLTINDVKKFYEQYIHPSNLFITKSISDVNPSSISQFLKTLEEKYLNNYGYKEIDVKYPLKNENRYWIRPGSLNIDGNDINNGNDNCKYYANLDYDFKKLKLNAKQKDVLTLLSFNINDPFEEDFLNYIQSLGYEVGSRFESYNVHGSTLILISRNYSLVKEEVLVENAKKIINYVKEKLQSLSDDELKQNYVFLQNIKTEVNTNDMLKDPYDSIEVLKDPYMYRNNILKFLFESSLKDYGEFFTNMVFDMNQNNEILNTKESIFKNIKENLNVFEILANCGPTYIDVHT